MTVIDNIIDEVIRAEGPRTSDPVDSGGDTEFGISKNAHPEAWADGHVTRDEARAIYLREYVLPFEGIADELLLHQLVDAAVMSSATTVIGILQQLVGVATDGVIGPKTLAAVTNYPAGELFGVKVPGFVLLNLAFRNARVVLYAGIAKRRPKDLKFLLGWIHRALEFK